MKKVLSILAVMTLTVGLFSCEADSNIEETEALFEVEQNASDDGEEESGERGGN